VPLRFSSVQVKIYLKEETQFVSIRLLFGDLLRSPGEVVSFRGSERWIKGGWGVAGAWCYSAIAPPALPVGPVAMSSFDG
jgi:hypothetical protein